VPNKLFYGFTYPDSFSYKWVMPNQNVAMHWAHGSHALTRYSLHDVEKNQPPPNQRESLRHDTAVSQ
jgi:hypothetical protein